jgi:fructose-1,6-bisphosphatase/inositol monophosphatase family enzyme
MDQPFTRERFWGTGRLARFRGPDGSVRRVRTRACARLEAAMLTTTHPDLLAAGHEQQSFLRVKERVRAARYGGDCYAYCLLAAGHIDIIVEAGLAPYDVAALIPIIEGAGGRITTWTGAPAAGGGRIVACGDPSLHEVVLKLLADRGD